MATTVLSKAEATDLTRRIRENTQRNASLLREAWAGKVWVPLGYETFNNWLEATIGVSRQRAYQLIAIVTMTESLQAAVPLPPDFTLTDVQTRSIISFGTNEFIAKLRKLVSATTSPEENVEVVLQALAEMRKSVAVTAAKPQLVSSHGSVGPTSSLSAADRTPDFFNGVVDALHAHAYTFTEVNKLDHETLHQLQLAVSSLRARLTEMRSVMGVTI